MSQIDKILRHFQRGLALTSKQANDLYGCTRLASVVGKLKKRGHDISSRMIEVQNRDQKSVLVAEYRLETKAVRQQSLVS